MTAHETPRGFSATDTQRGAGDTQRGEGDTPRGAGSVETPRRTPEPGPRPPEAPRRTPEALKRPPDLVKRTGLPPRPTVPTASSGSPGTVLPDSRLRRPAAPRSTSSRPGDRVGPTRTSGAAGRARRVRLALKRVDPWSVFLFSLLASVFAGLAVVVAVAALYAVLGSLGVVASLNELVGEVTGEGSPLITPTRFLGGAAVLAAVNVVLLTLLATLSALLYNVCASFTGGIELTLGERDAS